MYQNEAKIIRKKYLAASIISMLALLIVYCLLVFLFKSVLFDVFSIIIFVFAVRFVKVYIANKYIHSILLNEANPQKYGAVMRECKSASPIGSEWLNYAYYTADYQTTINLCHSKLKNKKLKKYQHIYIICLARAYFELGDFENLRKMCDEFDTITKDSARGEKIRNHFVIMKYYRLYLDGKHEECKELYEKVLQSKKYTGNTISASQANFSYAIALYNTGYYENAKQVFSQIIEKSPLLQFADISKKYIECIDSHTEYAKEPVIVLPEPDYIPPQPNKALFKVNKILSVVAVIIVSAVIVFGLYLHFSSVKRTNDVISAVYDDFVYIDAFELYKNDEYIDSVCLVDTQSDGLVMGTFYTYADDENTYLDVLATEIKLDEQYIVDSTTTYNYIGFTVFSDKDKADSVTNSYKTVKFKYNNKTCYLCFTYIDEENPFI